MTTPAFSIGCFLAASLLGAIGQYLYKAGAECAAGSIRSYLFNARLAGGVVCYVAVMALFVAAFKRGGQLTVLYPLYALTFVWAAIIAWIAFGQPIKPVNLGGMMLLICGMYLMGK